MKGAILSFSDALTPHLREGAIEICRAAFGRDGCECEAMGRRVCEPMERAAANVLFKTLPLAGEELAGLADGSLTTRPKNAKERRKDKHA